MKPWLSTLLALATFGCHAAERPFRPLPNETPASCEARRSEFSRFIMALPERAVRLDVSTGLPVSTLGVPPGAGSVLEVSERAQRLDGSEIDRKTLAERLANASGPLYVAVPPGTTIAALRSVLALLPKAVEPRLLVRTERSAKAFFSVPGASERSRELAAELLAERDPQESELAKRAFAELNDCPAIAGSVAKVEGLGAGDRWPALKKLLSDAVPHCPCASLDTAGLSTLLLAEQRAGTATLGALPLAFLRDVRCGATMPLRSVQRLLEQIERFDADYAGRFQDDALRFETVVTNDRLLVQFCDALPGETLAALQKSRSTLWVRFSSGACDGFAFEPLSPGAPMGTLRRMKSTGSAPLAFHYWQAAEEIALFGPVPADAPTKPTDRHEWPCRVNYKLTGIEPGFVALETGRFFFTEAACRAAPPETVTGGCFAELAAP